MLYIEYTNLIEEYNKLTFTSRFTKDVDVSFIASVFNNHNDKAGNPYFIHCFIVGYLSYYFSNFNSLYGKMGLFHDYLEDIEDPSYVFTEEEKEILDNLTRRKEKYKDYFKRVISNPVSLLVKICDSFHNSQISRYKIVSEEIRNRCLLYEGKTKELLHYYNKHIGR